MRNNVLINIIFFLFLIKNGFAESISIQSKNITLDKNKEISVFQNDVVIKTQNEGVIKSDFAEYNKLNGLIKLRGNIEATDNQQNKIETKIAEYDENKKIFKSVGPTTITTTEKYIIEGEDIFFDNGKGFILSEKNAVITDKEKNKIYLENFEYLTQSNIFKSIGYIKIEDIKNNSYEFSQLYIDTKKREVIGTDIKAFLNNEQFKINEENKPRVFANAIEIKKNQNLFKKSIFTLCNYRKNDKCPPWTIQASKMLHDNKKKTIYYDNALVKVYDIPIFYIPKLSHPDPSVERRSGFLPPSFSTTKNLGFGMSIPYFFAVDDDKNFTLTNRMFVSENPLFMGEYHQAFKNSNFMADFGFTKGYKKTSSTKKGGDKSHFFSKFDKNFKGKNNSDNNLSVSIQDVSNDKYLKLYKINSNLVDYNQDTLESSINFTHEKDDVFLGLNASIYETIKDTYDDKYEYILPEVTLDKNLISDEKLGFLDLQSNLKVHNYDTNKLTNFFVNDLDWSSKNIFFRSGLKNNFLANLRNINYEAKNVEPYKDDTTSEVFGAIGFSSELNLVKKSGLSKHFFTPKFLFRYSPGTMRKEEQGFRLDPINAFSLNRLENLNNYETGSTSTVGFDYKIKGNDKKLDFSLAQVISEKENKKMHSKTSMDEKLSDLTGKANLQLNKNFSINYKFNLDQNYNDFNYNEIGTNLQYGNVNFDFNYLQENKHLGNQDYFQTKIKYENIDNSLISFETKRNLITDSSEFYNLSYEYINDCLRAGLVYRREFYNDSEIEPENSLMFKITLTPFGSLNTPSFSQ